MQAPEPQAVSQFVWELINFNRTKSWGSGQWCTARMATTELVGPLPVHPFMDPWARQSGVRGTCALVMVPPCAPPLQHAHSQPAPRRICQGYTHAAQCGESLAVARSLLADSAV